MRAALVVAALAAGCGPLLGIDDHFTSPDAEPGPGPGSDAPPPPTNRVGVSGHSSLTYHTELAAMTEPEDLSLFAIDAYILDDTGLHVYPGTGSADGTFEIPDVPARDYHLRLTPKAGGQPQIWHLLGHDVDLSRDLPGRPGLTSLASPSPVSLTAPAMRRYLSRDDLKIYSSLLAQEVFPSWTDGGRPITGLDRLNGATFDRAGSPALDDNGLWIVHHGLPQTIVADLEVTTSTEAAHVGGLHQNAGELLPLSFAFNRGTTANTTMTIDVSALRPQPGVLEAMSLRLSATPDGGTGTFAGPEVLRASYGAPRHAPVAVHFVDYADPFPTSWSRAAVVSYESLARAYIQQPLFTLFTDRISAHQIAAPGAELVVPGLAMRPPKATGITLGGQPIVDAVQPPGEPLRLTWDAVPTATSYTVAFVVLSQSKTERMVATTAVPALVVPGGTFPDQAHLGISVGVAIGGPLEPAVRRVAPQRVLSEHMAALLLVSSTCGNGDVDPGEACDARGESETCNYDCTLAKCGDAIRNAAAHEDCDPGTPTPSCDAQCHAVVCGDGVVGAGEQCDDSNTKDGDGCNSACELESLLHCGDGILDPGEQCDDGNPDNLDDCNTQCKAARCGDGVIESNARETCDDGNFITGDGCSEFCRIERCGDGFTIYPEQCDDLNNADGDGCSADCRRE